MKWTLLKKTNYEEPTNTNKKFKIFTYSIPKKILVKYFKKEILKFEFTQKLHLADIILVTNLHFRKNYNLKQYAKKTRIPVLSVKI